MMTVPVLEYHLQQLKIFFHEAREKGCSQFSMSSSQFGGAGLASVLRGLREHHAEQEPATDESGSDSEALSTSSSCSSLREDNGLTEAAVPEFGYRALLSLCHVGLVTVFLEVVIGPCTIWFG